MTSPHIKVDINTLVKNVTCPECNRVFNLLFDDDAQEWYYGHDCEA
jgi:hypothetical protein